MKILFYSLLALTILAGCADEDKKDPEPKSDITPTAEESKIYYAQFDSKIIGQCNSTSNPLQISVLQSAKKIFITKNSEGRAIYAAVRIYISVSKGTVTYHYYEFLDPKKLDDPFEHISENKIIEQKYSFNGSAWMLGDIGVGHPATSTGRPSVVFNPVKNIITPGFINKSFILVPSYTDIDMNGQPLTLLCP